MNTPYAAAQKLSPNELALRGEYATPPPHMFRWEVITYYVKLFGFRIGAEIGVSKGENFINCMKLNTTLKLYGIDSYESEGNSLERYDEGIYEGREKNSMIERAEKIEKLFTGRASMIYLDSKEASEFIPNGHLDFVFIDADHTYEGVQRDIELWEPKVKENGLLMGHDLNWGSVARAVGENFKNFWIAPDNVWASPKIWLKKRLDI